MAKVFIDGSAGTTGLQIHARMKARKDVELLCIPEALRKDPEARKGYMNEADVVFLCLPDAAAVEAAAFIDNPNTCVIDTSTAHRVDPDWVYGFAELGFAEKIRASKRIANPGCHATGFLSTVFPLVSQGAISKTAQLCCYSLTGYSGGGKKMIAEYEAEEASVLLKSPAAYGLSQAHKHLPEMQKISGLCTAPVFCPIVDDYLKGMETTLMLHRDQLQSGFDLDKVRQLLADFYAGQKLISVVSGDEASSVGRIYANEMSGKDSLKIYVCGNDEAMTVTAVFDNLGKGASGAAIENMNYVLGVDETTGLCL